MKNVFLLLLTVFVGSLWYINENLSKKIEIKTTQTPVNCKPAFADGGGPYYQPNAPFRTKLAPEIHTGTKLVVSGKVVKSDCKTDIPNAIIDIWHADENGKYVNDWYRGKIKTNDKGEYSFETVVPKGYGEGTGYRPPHIHFKVFIDNEEVITSQMFFPDVTGKSGFDDAYIMKVETKEENGQSVHYATHTIVLP